MNYSKANLTVGTVASKAKFDRGLNGVFLPQDGSTVGCNGKMLMAVGPVDAERVRMPETIGEPITLPEQGLVLPLDLIAKAIKALARTVLIQYAMLSQVPDPARVGFTCVDEKGDTTTVAALPRHDPYPRWIDMIRSLRGDGEGFRVCLNRGDLIELLKAMESACPNKGEANPVFLEFSEGGRGLVARCKNHDTGQHAIGAINAYKMKEGTWLECDSWEKKIFGMGAEKKKKTPPLKKTGGYAITGKQMNEINDRMHEGGK